MNGIILGVSLKDFRTELKKGDLVCYDEEFDDFYTIIEINDKFLVKEKGTTNDAKYIVVNKVNGKLINFERNEISKSTLAIFDADRYFEDGVKIKIGNISNEDILNMKYKVLIEEDRPRSDLERIMKDDLIGLTFVGDIVKKPYRTNNHLISDFENYFKIKTRE